MAEPTYFYGVASSVAGANKRHLAVFNPVGSGKTIKVYSIKASPAPMAAATGLNIGLVCLRITSAPTGGTSTTVCEAVTADADPPGAIVAMVGATGGATEPAGVGPFGNGAVSGEETVGASGDVLYEAPIDGAKPVTLAPGEGFLVKQTALASAGAISVTAKVSIV